MIQQGNDLTLIWKITDPRGGEVNFSTFDTYEVLIESDYSNNVVKAITSAQGSELTFVFKAKDQEATGYYSLIFNATQNGKGFRVEAPRVIELEGARAAKAETGDENNILRITSTLAVYLGGRDGMSPYIGANGNWWVFSDETKVYVDTGIKADYTGENDAAMAELKAATDAAVLINTSIQKDEVTRVANEDARITNENTRKSNEAERVKAEAARDAKYNQINAAEQERVKSEQDRVINEDIRISDEVQRIANEADRVKRFAALESEVDNAASMAIAAGNTAIAQGNTAAAQGVKAESQGNTAAAQGNDAKAKGDAAKTQGDYAKAQGDYAKAQGDYAKTQGDGIVGRFTEDEGSIKRENIHPLQGKATGLKLTSKASHIVDHNIRYNSFSISFYISEIDNINADSYVIGIPSECSIIFGYGGTNPVFIAKDINGNRLDLRIAGAIKAGKNPMFTLVFDNGVAKWYYNGLFISKMSGFATSQLITRIYPYCAKDRSIDFYSLRLFDYALSPEEVKELYNNGRPDKVVLGNERKALSIIDGIDNFNGWDNLAYVNSTENNTRISPKSIYTGGDAALLYILSDKMRNSRISITITGIPSGSRFECGAGTIPESEQSIKKDGTYIIESGRLKGFKFYPSGVDYTGVSIKMNGLKCIAEYLPSSLTPTQWRDTSGNGNHLTATGTPELIYTPTFCDHIIKETPPNIIPDFVGQKYTDKTAKVIYEAVGMTAVSDWVLISK